MLVRKSLREILEAHESFEVVGESGDGVAAMAQVKSLTPDLLVLDVAMPRTNGVEVIEEVRRWCPDTRIVVVTGVESAQLLQHVVDSGADGIFHKSEDTGGWVDEFLNICEGGQRISPTLDGRFDQDTAATSLTRRERQVLFGIARGEGNAEIAARLGVSRHTIDKHRTSIMRKLDVHSAPQLVSRAFRDGLLGASEID